MKIADVKVGMAVALPYGSRDRYANTVITQDDLREGAKARRGVIVGVGSYRLRMVGLCGEYEAVETKGAPQRVVVLAQRPRYGYEGSRRMDPWKITPETEWDLEVMDARKPISLEVWEQSHADWLFLQGEVLATQERLRVVEQDRMTMLLDKIKTLTGDDLAKVIDQFVLSRIHNDADVNGKITQGFKLESRYLSVQDLPWTSEELAQWQRLTDEITLLQEKLTCRR